jgi:predicted TPR repeat methyltransferase
MNCSKKTILPFVLGFLMCLLVLTVVGCSGEANADNPAYVEGYYDGYNAAKSQALADVKNYPVNDFVNESIGQGDNVYETGEYIRSGIQQGLEESLVDDEINL